MMIDACCVNADIRLFGGSSLCVAGVLLVEAFHSQHWGYESILRREQIVRKRIAVL